MDRSGDTRNRALAGVRAAAQRHRRPLGIAAALVSLALAVLWTQVVPDRAETAPPVQAATVRWAHPLCWALLAGSAACWALGALKRVTETLARLALGAYAAFLLALAI